MHRDFDALKHILLFKRFLLSLVLVVYRLFNEILVEEEEFAFDVGVLQL